MARQLISSGTEFETKAAYSRAVADGEWVFVAGTVGRDYATGELPSGAAAQARQAFDNIEWALGEAGASLADVVRYTLYIVEAADMEQVMPVLAERLGGINPAGTAVRCDLLVPEARLEIEVTALRRQG